MEILFAILTVSFLANLFCLVFTMIGRPIIDATLGSNWAFGNICLAVLLTILNICGK